MQFQATIHVESKKRANQRHFRQKVDEISDFVFFEDTDFWRAHAGGRRGIDETLKAALKARKSQAARSSRY
jgi:hypothetical protein